LRTDRRFNIATNDLWQFPGCCQEEFLDDFWNGIYNDQLNRFQDEFLSLMGQRLGWYFQALINLNQPEHLPIKKIINTERPAWGSHWMKSRNHGHFPRRTHSTKAQE
jgi:hypothetical protein